MKIGDLVKMKRGYSVPGLITSIANQHRPRGCGLQTPWAYVTVEWPDEGRSLEKSRDLEVISENR